MQTEWCLEFYSDMHKHKREATTNTIGATGRAAEGGELAYVVHILPAVPGPGAGRQGSDADGLF